MATQRITLEPHPTIGLKERHLWAFLGGFLWTIAIGVYTVLMRAALWI